MRAQTIVSTYTGRPEDAEASDVAEAPAPAASSASKSKEQ